MYLLFRITIINKCFDTLLINIFVLSNPILGDVFEYIFWSWRSSSVLFGDIPDILTKIWEFFYIFIQKKQKKISDFLSKEIIQWFSPDFKHFSYSNEHFFIVSAANAARSSFHTLKIKNLREI